MSVDIHELDDESAEVIIRATTEEAAAEAKDLMDVVNMDVSFDP